MFEVVSKSITSSFLKYDSKTKLIQIHDVTTHTHVPCWYGLVGTYTLSHILPVWQIRVDKIPSNFDYLEVGVVLPDASPGIHDFASQMCQALRLECCADLSDNWTINVDHTIIQFPIEIQVKIDSFVGRATVYVIMPSRAPLPFIILLASNEDMNGCRPYIGLRVCAKTSTSSSSSTPDIIAVSN